jgi:hypothetical protein
MGVFAVDFRSRARNWWGLLVSNRASFEGRPDEGEGQGAGLVRLMWMRVEMWERGVNLGIESGTRDARYRRPRSMLFSILMKVQ